MAITDPEPELLCSDLLPLGPDQTPYWLLGTEGVSTAGEASAHDLDALPTSAR